MQLLDLLKYRFQIAEKFTEDFHREVKRCIDDYKLSDTEKDTMQDLLLDVNRRYEFRIPYIFATHESMLSSMFDRVPQLIFTGRGLKDEEKKKKIEAAYDYINDIVGMESFLTTSAWWFILTGFVSSHADWKTETRDVPVLDDMGNPMLDATGNMMIRSEYVYNDPILEVDDPVKVYWSPESIFSEKGDKIPYKFKKVLMEVDEIKSTYGKKVEPDVTIKIKNFNEKETDDIKRATVYFYYGRLPEENKSDVKDLGAWKYSNNYYIVFTKNQILYKEVEKIGRCKLGKWHSIPTEFFGFGIGKTLREHQKELSIRRGQEMRYADLAAFPKIAVEETSKVDEKALLDPRALPVLMYREKAPEYLVPPELSRTVMIAEDKAREDAQFVSGMLDLSKGAQDTTTVSTATGQSIFAEAAEKRIRQAKRQFGRFFKEVVVTLLKLAQENWDDEKLITITDQDGSVQDITVTGEDLRDIDFDRDLDIDIESISVNKEVLRAQAIEFYDKVKDDPMVKRDMVIKDTLRDGFGKKNPENYINQQAIAEAEMQGQMGGQPDMQSSGVMGGQPMADAGNGEVPSSQSGVMGSAQ